MEMSEAKVVGSRKAGARIASGLAIVCMNIWVPVMMIVATVVGILVFPFLAAIWLLVTDWPIGKIMRHFVWLYGRIWLWIVSPFVRVKYVGAGSKGLAKPAVFVANHLSFFDIYFLSAVPAFDVVIFVRSWPFKLAWYAPFMRLAEYPDVERLRWESIIEASRRFVGKGHSILVFPQGHRSRDGQLGRFHSGAFRLAQQLGVPIIPICIKGTDRVLPPGRRWLAPSRVRMECLEPIDPSAFQEELGHIKLRKHVKKLMGACLAGN